VNDYQKDLVLKKIEALVWNLPKKTIGVLGLSFKPDTDDIRQAPALEIIEMLQEEGARIKVYDPEAMGKARAVLSKKTEFCKDAYAAAKNSDCLLLATEWNEFKELDFKKIKRLMRQPILIDGRNIYDPVEMKKLGFTYVGIGRK
ncbi:MAG TPA: UDP binding domain-containing protein, partial [Candidatus Omnitrophota bacterium]|nr:UDP binding domain-containing protein [Candidatus Omnitrophota bacterium]